MIGVLLISAATAQAQKAQKDSKKKPASEEKPAAADEPTPDPEDAPDEDLPRLDKKELPSFSRLMKGPAVDWLVIINSLKVIEIEPLYPRPGTLDYVNQKIKDSLRKPGDPPETEEAKRKRLALYELPLTLPDGEEQDFKLHLRWIKEIIYYEDLMLKRVDLLLDERKVREAYELLLALQERQADWPGVTPRRERLLFTEAAAKLEGNLPEHALALLEELHDKNSNYPQIQGQLNAVADRLINEALKREDPRQARAIIRRLARRLPNSPIVPQWTNQLQQETRDLITRSASEERAGRTVAALNLAESAARLAPEVPDVLGPFNRLSGRHQRLRVGVLDLPSEQVDRNKVILSSADERRRQLTQLRLFDQARAEGQAIRYDTRGVDEWEPADLGRSLVIRLHTHRATWESRPLLTAGTLAAAISDRMSSDSPKFDARFGGAVNSVAVRSPFELVVHFDQPPLRPEALFAFEISGGSAPGDTGNQVAANSVTAYPFHLAERNQGRAVYRRSIPEPDASNDRHVAEIIEIKYDSHDRAVQAMLRGEVLMLPKIRTWQMKNFAARNDLFTLRYGLPASHVLQFHPQSKAAASRTLRRALVYALNRGSLLREVFLHEAPGPLGRVISGPFPTKSYAHNRFVTPHKFDPALAYSLAHTAKKELGGDLPTLHLRCPEDEDVREAAREMIVAWNEAGITVDLVPPQSEGWDLLYRVERLADPLVDLWPFVAQTTATDTAAISHLPAWLRHDLLALDQAGDWKSAEEILHRLHKQFWAEVYLIPLWEVEEFLVVRRTVRGIPSSPLAVYQNVDQWKVEPWFSRE